MRTWLPILGVALAAACREPAPPPPPPPPTPAPAPAPAAPTAHVSTMARLDQLAVTSDRVSAESMKTVAGRLQYEAAHRPTTVPGAPRAEDVLASLAAAGIELAEQKQYVAMTVKAAYCVGGQTATGLSVAVCEYDSPASAAAGRAFVEERFRIPELTRVIHVRGATTLALGHHAGSALGDVARRAEQAFRTM